MSKTLTLIMSLVAFFAFMQPAHADVSWHNDAYYALHWRARVTVDNINTHRVEAGVRPLYVSGRLHKVAYRWSKNMAVTQTLIHNRAGLESLVANGWATVGENVGVGTDVKSLNVAWWDSDGHRANILDPDFRRIGPGFKTDSRGKVWGTVDFGRK